MKLSDLSKQNQNLKFLVYGTSGAGKTVFSSSFPGPIFFADFDGKIISARNYLEVHNPEKLTQIEYENFQPTAENGGLKVFHKFAKTITHLEGMAKDGKFPFKSLVVDSLTSFSDMMLKSIMLDNPSIKRVDQNVPAMQDYLILASQFKDMIYKILALPCNVVMVAHMVQDKDEQNGAISYRPSLPGKLPELLPKLFHEVYYAYVDTVDGKPVHIAQTKQMNRFVANTIIQNMPPKIPLSFEAINKVINGGVNNK